VWEALLQDMPMTALIRNLATLTRVGLLSPLSKTTKKVVAQLGDAERLRKARVHPIAVLSALRTYASGHGARGSNTWQPVSSVVDALDAAFYASFGSLTPSNARHLLALDVSGSMSCGEIAGVAGLTPRDGTAAMALVTGAVEENVEYVAFSDHLVRVNLGRRVRLDAVLAQLDAIPMGGTDCALPMLWALENKVETDVFVVYTDSETWFGKTHPVQALAKYRQETGIAARLIVVGMVANKFTIANPNDAGMLDVVGFDTASPQLMSDFAAGTL
jgi:60 kDa SS-A/Ro ribonucleoprotein